MDERRNLTDRKLDMLYITFFAVHIPATLLIDLQTLYSPSLRPTWLHNLFEYYLTNYNDPIVSGAIGRWVPLHPASWLWIRSFLWMEALFQLPLFFLGIYHLTKDNRAIYPWLLAYAAHSTTTVIPATVTLLATPVGSTAIAGAQVSHAQFYQLIAGYLPFLIITMVMTIDMALRLSAIVKSVTSTSGKLKSKTS